MSSSLHTRLRLGLGAIALAMALLSVAAVAAINRLRSLTNREKLVTQHSGM